MFHRYVIFAAGLTAALFSCNTNTQPRTAEVMPDSIDYSFHIRPILSDKCFACHGPDANKREAGLRLDIADSAYKALQESPDMHALVPGNPRASAVFLRITTEDSSLRMPPPASNMQLSASP
ncbi:c-type cytochrome domain-containing protein [Chitinophaga sp.]|mgnify:CR=1 FL=1|uniref:c-type cytochrome domain-containing protein n=1 Tax=Chitinophaga sp. TaxID=1869181 RepID=UPI002623F765|nr:c-type cytochrome domain-containing protein [uncultured Chitinophaga sp.]